jgi:hypothetical protein
MRSKCDVRLKKTNGGIPPKGVKLISQWIAVSDANGVAVFDSDDPIAMAKWVKNWSDLLTIEIYPVISGESLAKIIKSLPPPQNPYSLELKTLG